MNFRLLAAIFALGLVTACDSGNDPQPPAGGLTLLVAQTTEGPGEVCPYGGTVVSAGLDTDHDGVLDSEEVAKTEPVCDPAPGTPPPVLTRTAAEAAGESCSEGGTRIEAGRDTSGDGLLGDDEVERTAYACTPEAPAVLTRVDYEQPGSRCLAGGSAVRFGPDTDGSGALEDPEVAGVQYLCETHVLPGFTVRTRADAELVSMASVVEGYLYIEVTEAIDLDISPTAVTHGVVVRSPALTGLGLYIWTVGEYVRVEGNPKLERFWLSTEALGGDVVVRDNPELTSLILPNGKGMSELYPFRYSGDVVIARNAKLPYFGLRWPTEVGGDLVVEGNPLLRYLFFEGLTRIGGDLVLADNDAMEELPSLTGFPLETVGGLLDIRDNANLVRCWLDTVQATGGLRLARNARLSYPRFPELVAVLGSVTIQDNPALFSFYPAGRLRVVTGWFSVERNAILSSLGDFNDVVEIGETLTVANNPRLQDLAFDRLVTAGGVSVLDNPLLETIGPSPSPGDPFVNPPSLTRLETLENMYVARNATLRQLVLPAMGWISSSLTVQDNPLLPACQAQAIPASYRSVTGNDDTATCP